MIDDEKEKNNERNNLIFSLLLTKNEEQLDEIKFRSRFLLNVALLIIQRPRKEYPQCNESSYKERERLSCTLHTITIREIIEIPGHNNKLHFFHCLFLMNRFLYHPHWYNLVVEAWHRATRLAVTNKYCAPSFPII